MAALFGVNGDGAVYADAGSGLVWIPDVATFDADGYNWSDIQWVDVLPYPAANPYQASDNPQGASAPAPPQAEAVVGPANIVAGYSITPQGQVVASSEAPAGSIAGPITLAAGYTIFDVGGQATVGPVGGITVVTPPPTTTAPPTTTTPVNAPNEPVEPVEAVVGPANIVAGYSITPQGQVVASYEAPLGSIPGPIVLAAGYTIYDVDGQATVAPVGTPPGTLTLDPTTVPIDPTVYGIRQPAGSGTTVAPTFNGKITAQGNHTLLLSAMQNEGQNGVLTAQVIANTMQNAVS